MQKYIGNGNLLGLPLAMSEALPHATPERYERRWAFGLFVGLLGFHLWAVTVGWTSLNLPGGEFRQAQTAISAFFIQRDDNYALNYPTPVLGKPWSVPMEFPLYQWTVAKLSTATGWPLTQTGRGVNLACFYLTFPALFLLLGRLGVSVARRWVMLGFLLTCPLYVFYGRAFLIETMALMFSVWFLVGYVRAVEHRRVGWLVFAMACGIGAGLVKVTTFLLILMPALLWTFLWLWRARPGQSGGGGREIARVVTWALSVVALPCVLSIWWIRQADAVKALNPVGAFLASDNLTSFNLGIGQRWNADIWAQHWAIWQAELIRWPLLLVVGATALFFLRRHRALAGWLIFFFLAVQTLFPVLYAYHEYYYIANGFLLMLAVGLVAGGVLDSRLPRATAWLLVLAIQVGQIASSVHTHYAEMKNWSFGGSAVTEVLRAFTDPDDVIVAAGEDWNSMIPYNSQRRALMFPNGRESEPEFVAVAFAQLRGERIGALVLRGAQQENHRLIAAAVSAFELDARPVFTWQNVTVYLRQDLRLVAVPKIKSVRGGESIELTPESLSDVNALVKNEVEVASLPAKERGAFARMSPAPWKYYTSFGADLVPEAGQQLFTAHPDTTLWFKVPAGAREVSVECYIAAGAYDATVSDGDATDGVEFTFYRQAPNGSRVQLLSRLLDPRRRADDRGIQTLIYRGDFPAGSELVVVASSGPHQSLSRDWAFFGAIQIK
ncbi:ArnT family glycosyltransferase [Oleiharenicola lentus]|uniref:ArnT family glycosyltransferase n=1 Tax=Oleiharenicola lentus TaxID=2508720 RepID=UPI003F661A86